MTLTRPKIETEIKPLPPPIDTQNFSKTLLITTSSKQQIAHACSVACNLEGFVSCETLYFNDILIHYLTYEYANKAMDALKIKFPSILVSFHNAVANILNCTLPFYHTMDYKPIQMYYTSQPYPNYDMNQE
jgi:hypothetical protein